LTHIYVKRIAVSAILFFMSILRLAKLRNTEAKERSFEQNSSALRKEDAHRGCSQGRQLKGGNTRTVTQRTSAKERSFE
jgi:hypothetical protein